MKITTYHGIFSLSLIFLLLSPQFSIRVVAQSDWRRPNQNTNLYPYSRFSSSLAIIISVLVTSIVFLVFFFIYIRYCASLSSARARPVVVRAVADTRGLDASVIESFPTFSYSEVKDHKIGKETLECAVCLNEFEDDETLRLIPKCDHVFHPECIDAWLESHVTCPVCRADLVPQPEDNLVHHVSGPAGSMDEEDYVGDDTVERSNSRNDEVVLQIDDENQRHERPNLVNRNLSFQNPYGPSKRVVNRNLSFGNPDRMLRSWTMMPRMFGQSQSSGNTPVQPGEDVERFTLRLPSELREKVIHRASLNRTKSFAIKSGENNEDDKIGRTNREVKSDRWIFFTRALSMSLRSPRGVAETGESSGSTSKGSGSRTLNKLRSFNCMEPIGADEAGLISGEPVKPTV